MNPDLQQNTQTTQLDPSVVNLARSIAQQESGGNYNAPVGKDGEIGAYQMTPDFINNYAPKYGIDPNSIATDPASQDKLAYSVIKDWGTQGDPAYPHIGPLSPAEIASAWNAGDPHAYLEDHSGVNSTGTPYNTNSYVNNVQKNYEQFSGNTQDLSSPQKSPQQSPDWTAAIGAAVAGGAGWLLGNLGNIGQRALPGLGAIAGKAALGEFIGGPAGAIIGASTGGLIGSLGGQNQPQGQPQGSSGQPQTQDNLIQQLLTQLPQAHQASQQLASTQMQALQTLPTGRVMAQDPNIQEAIGAMGRYGLAPNIDENGMQDYSQAQQKARELLGQISKGNEKVLETENESAPMQEVVTQAKASVRKYAPSNEWADADNEIDKSAKQYLSNFGKKGNMSLNSFERMRKETGPAAKFDMQASNAKRSANKAIYHAARATIENHTKHKEFYNAAMKEEQRLINGMKVMKKLNGKKAPHQESIKHSLLKEVGRLAGGYLGDKIGGPAGAIIGYLVSRHVINAADKKYGKNIFETPAMQKALQYLHSTKPAMYAVMERELKQAGIQANEKKVMDAANAIVGQLRNMKTKKATGKIAHVGRGIPNTPPSSPTLLKQKRH